MKSEKKFSEMFNDNIDWMLSDTISFTSKLFLYCFYLTYKGIKSQKNCRALWHTEGF